MKLYKRDSKQKLRVLEIYSEGNKVVQKHGLVDGQLVVNESVCIPKNVGKANETTAEEQAELEAKSKIKKKLDEGYVSSIDHANSNKVLLPMLAKDYKKEMKKVEFPFHVQPKLDGMRALNSEKGLISRKGIDIITLSHISKISIPEGVVLDGELYAHGLPFQENMKLIKKERPESVNVKYHVYDIVSDKPFTERFDELIGFLKSNETNFELVPTYKVNNEKELKEYHLKFLSEGYEGTIIRHGESGYEIDKRSSSLLKYKDFIDEACEIIDVKPSEKRPDQAIFICELNGKQFGCGMKFSHSEREEILEKKEEYIGKTAEIRFFEYSNDGVPRFPVCVGIRLDK